MSFYNMIFGQNEAAKRILEILKLEDSDFYRFRDAYIDEHRRIAVYTRGGGNNRKCWNEFSENSSPQCTPTEHADVCVVTMQNELRKHKDYIEDKDDDFDNTYCTFFFRVDPERIADMQSEYSGDEKWDLFLTALRESKDAPKET